MRAVLNNSNPDDLISAFINRYENQSDLEKNVEFLSLVQELYPVGVTPIQFGRIAQHLLPHHLCQFCETIFRLRPDFLQNSLELMQLFSEVDVRKMQDILVQDKIQTLLRVRGFLDNLAAFSAIFTGRLTLEKQEMLCYFFKDILLEQRNYTSFDAFYRIFRQLPTLRIKELLFDAIVPQLPRFIMQTDDVKYIERMLRPQVIGDEDALFKRMREIVFRQFIRDRMRLREAFYATLFLIADHYPGGQKDKLQRIVDAALNISNSDGIYMPVTIDAILLQTKLTMNNERVTSTRLRLAITVLIDNVSSNTPIEVDLIKGLALDKNTTRTAGLFQSQQQAVQVGAVERESNNDHNVSL